MSNSVDGSASNTSGKTLSKATIYAPLAAYAYDDPASFVRTKRLSSSLQESSVFEFFGRISTVYHRSSSVVISKNSANRPTSVQEFKEKLQQRALTLVKGGINSSPASNKNSHKVASSKKRKRTGLKIAWKTKDETRLLNALSQEMKRRQYDFVMQLHRLWKHHVRVMVMAWEEEIGTIAVSERLQAVAGQIEWIGARVLIQECKAHPTWTNRQGILISSTTNVWKVLESTRKGTDCRFDFMVVPKVGSVLVALYPQNSDRMDEDSINDDPHFSIVI